MSASTASSTTTTAASPLATGRPAASRSTRSSTVSPPGERALLARRHGERRACARPEAPGGRGLPLANAGRGHGRLAPPAVASSRGAWPTRSTWTCTLGVKPSSIGISSVCEPAVDREALLAQEAAAAQGEDPLGGSEGRQHQDPRHVARAVLLPVGDERHLLFLEVPAGRHAPSGHPDPQLGLVLAPARVRDPGHDAPGAALLRLEARAHGLARGRKRALLDVLRDLLPLALDLLPVEPLGAQAHRAPRDREPLEVGRDRVDHDGLALLHESPLRPQAHVELRGMDEEVRPGGPGLPVDVLDRGLGRARPAAAAACARSKSIRRRWTPEPSVRALIVSTRSGAAGAEDAFPPGHERPEDEVVPVRRAEAARLRAHPPAHLRAGQGAARVVGGGHGDRRGAADDVGTLARLRLHLELGSAGTPAPGTRGCAGSRQAPSPRRRSGRGPRRGSSWGAASARGRTRRSG